MSSIVELLVQDYYSLSVFDFVFLICVVLYRVYILQLILFNAFFAGLGIQLTSYDSHIPISVKFLVKFYNKKSVATYSLKRQGLDLDIRP